MKKIIQLFKVFKDRIWVLGILTGLIIALTYISIKQLEANDGVVHFEVDVSRPFNEEDKERVREFAEAEENASKDIILIPSEPIDVLPGEERRRHDEERAEQEVQELQATIEAGIEAGIYVDDPPEDPACAAEAEAIEGVPSLYLLCGNEVVPAPSNIPFSRTESFSEAETLLSSYVLELLGDVSVANQDVGYESYFSNPTILNSLSLNGSGRVTLDFNEEFVEQQGHLHGSTAARMMEQLFKTIFQFREVNTVSVTLNSSCEAFAQLFQFACINIDRETWQNTLELNDEQVEFFNLMGGQ